MARAGRRRFGFGRSVGVRFAAVYALVFGLSSAGLATFLWWDTVGLLQRQVESAINVDARSLAARFQAGGLPLLIATINRRIALNVDDSAIYLVVDPSYQPVAGNLRGWPKVVARLGVWYQVPVKRAQIVSLAEMRGYQLPLGFRLLIGRDVEARARLRALVAGGLLWAVLVMVVLGIAGALAIRGLLQRALANVSRTANAIAGGDLSHRVALSGRGDEFDLLAETINDMLDRMSRLMDGVRQVSNAIAHDLRTPITRARARLEDALSHAEGDAALRAAIERATEDLDAINAIFQALLIISEIEAGARRAAFAAVELRPLLADLHELFTAAAEERGLALDLLQEDPAEAPTLLGDRELLQQALANLLDNALKFSPPGGRITLSVRRQGTMVEITVADQGPGIPPAERFRATERFYRAESARHTPGSGLGLSLVQAVAQLHGGSLRLEDNEPGLAATLALPAREPRPAPPAPLPAALPASAA